MLTRGVVGFSLCAVINGCGSSNPPRPSPTAAATTAPATAAPLAASSVECPEGAHWDGHSCIGELSCPEGAHIENSRCVADTSEAPSLPASAEVAEPAAPDAAPELATPASATARDPRKGAKVPRARALLVTELQALEQLLAATAKTSPDRVMLLRRLAENYVELEYAAEREHTPQSAKLVSAARKKAIEDYNQLRNEYPTYQKLDEVLYYAGYEYERGGDLSNARAKYRELVQRFPGSSFVARVPRSIRGKAF